MGKPKGPVISWENIEKLMDDKGWKQKELAEEIEKELQKDDPTHSFTTSAITTIKSKGRTSEKTLDALLKIFHPIAKEYLQGYWKDWKTKEEKERAILEADIKENELTRNYLRDLGFETELALFWRLSAAEIKEAYNAKDLQRFNPVKNRILSESDKKALEELTKKPLLFFLKQYEDIFYFEVSNNLPEILKEMKEEHPEGWTGGMYLYIYDEFHDVLMETRYKVKYKNKYIGSISIHKMKSLCNSIKNSTQAIIESFTDSQGYTDDHFISSNDPVGLQPDNNKVTPDPSTP